jgi:hypothetical protein
MAVAADGSVVVGGGGAMVVHRRENTTKRERPRWNLQIGEECGVSYSPIIRRVKKETRDLSKKNIGKEDAIGYLIEILLSYILQILDIGVWIGDQVELLLGLSQWPVSIHCFQNKSADSASMKRIMKQHPQCMSFTLTFPRLGKAFNYCKMIGSHARW